MYNDRSIAGGNTKKEKRPKVPIETKPPAALTNRQDAGADRS